MNMQKSLFIRFALTAMLTLAVGATGCSSDGGGGAGTGGGGDGGDGGMGGGGMGGDGGSGGLPGPGVTAEPAGATYPSGQTVTLTAGDSEATIYYTTDLTPVYETDRSGNVTGIQGMEYTGPVAMPQTGVLKFAAVLDGAGGSGGAGGAGGGTAPLYGPENLEGYVITTNPIEVEWAKSGHGDITADAWRNWDGSGFIGDPSYYIACGKCHGAQTNPGVGNSEGFLEYVTTGKMTKTTPLPLGLECAACHERFPTIYSDLETYHALEPVLFPSDEELSNWSPSNICMTCHQGRESGENVKDEIADDGGEGPYGFTNIHYYAAAATMFGSEAYGGYQYLGQDYRPRNTFPSHPMSFNHCVGCHMENAENGEKHTFWPEFDSCKGCHGGGDTFDTLGGSPQQSHANIETLVPELLAEIERYAATEITGPDGEDGWPIRYDAHDYPYWFDMNGDGYDQFDATLLPAAYNYQTALKDPAGYIHNGTYIQQLVFDSIEDLGGSTAVAVIGRGALAFNGSDIGDASESQQWQLSGHGAADEEPFRFWDEDQFGVGAGNVPSFCSKCHAAAGFANFAQGNPTGTHYARSAVDCWSCHSNFDLFSNQDTRWDDSSMGDPLEPVAFPSGATLTLGNNSNLCMGCHQGLASGLSVRTADPNDEVQIPDYDSFDAINIHYYAAAAVLFGRDSDAGYQYRLDPDDPDTEFAYQGQNNFVGFHTLSVPGQGEVDLVDCVGCHMNSNPDNAPAKHTFMPAEVDDCAFCHSGGPEFKDLQSRPRAYWFAIDTLKAQLLQAIEDYADGGGLPITSPVYYEGHEHPYWFHVDGPPVEANAYGDFDRNMLAAAYNYMVADKDPGAYIHNGIYIQQILWDSIIATGECPNLNPPPPGRDPDPPTCP